jgi:hypothetical protein
VTYDYAKADWRYRSWLTRYTRYVEAHGLICQDCGGMGGETVPILDDGTGPWEPCGWCAGTGYVTRWMRGIWLRSKAEEARNRKKAA